jgi:hypothetical protein
MTAIFAVNWQSMPNTSNQLVGLYVASTGYAIPISAQTFSQSTFFAVRVKQAHSIQPTIQLCFEWSDHQVHQPGFWTIRYTLRAKMWKIES